jgi:hypothetical protein
MQSQMANHLQPEPEVLSADRSENASFCAIFDLKKASLYQDRLGTNIGKTQKETRFHTAPPHHLQPLLFYRWRNPLWSTRQKWWKNLW